MRAKTISKKETTKDESSIIGGILVLTIEPNIISVTNLAYLI